MRVKNCLGFFAVAAFYTIIIAGPGTAADASEVKTKIGTVNIQVILDGSEAGKKALAELKSKAEKEKDNLEKKLEAVKKLEKEIESQRLVAKEGALSEKEQELKRLRRDLEASKEDTQTSFQKMQGQIMRKLVGDVNRIIKEYARKNGYTLVLDKGESPNMMGGFVIYADDSVDISSAIVKAYDEEQKAGKK
jgi:outer membrane protein